MTEAYKFFDFTIQPHMVASLEAYINTGRPTGGFLKAVLENNLMQACNRADSDNQANLPAFAGYLYNRAPMGCHGSPKKVQSWIDSGGLEGQERAREEG